WPRRRSRTLSKRWRQRPDRAAGSSINAHWGCRSETKMNQNSRNPGSPNSTYAKSTGASGDRRPRRASGPEGAQRRIAFRFGLSAESRAAAFLVAKGYRILARRFRTPLGEIDIVARRRGVLVFVEVKARDNFDEAAEAIGKRQQNRIIG